MRKEEYINIIERYKENLDEKIEAQIVKYSYNKLGENDVIEVYLKEGTSLTDMAKILTDLEDLAGKLGSNILVDFLSG
ncbi:MAG: hypothetical protein ACRCYE_14020 [Sarcina sp.]